MKVVLAVLQDAPPGLATRVAEELPHPWSRTRVQLERLRIDPPLDKTRLQVEATRLLDLLPEADPDTMLVVLLGLDLFLHPLAWVCGVAPLGGRRGIVSWARLTNGLPAVAPLAQTRIVKEVAHELGHAAGLPHCPVFDCVMHASLFPEEIDLKGADYCQACLSNLCTLHAGLAQVGP